MTSENKHSLSLTRRKLFKATGAFLGAAGLSRIINQLSDPLKNISPTRPEKLGATFSQVQCRDLGMSPEQTRQTYLKVLDLGLDVIRLGTYMDEISREGFAFTDWLLDQAYDKQIPVILTVGLKAPRVPEFFPDDKLEKRLGLKVSSNQMIGSDKETLNYVVNHTKKVINRYKEREIIIGWQLENEADAKLAFARNHAISPRLQDKEVEVARSESEKDIYLSSPFNLAGADQSLLDNIARKPYAAGSNVYYRIPNPRGGYYQLTEDDFKKLGIEAELIKQSGVKPIIFEAQAEPWEDGSHIHTNKSTYESSNPDLAIKLASKLTLVGYQTILLWGCEYWVYMADYHPNPDVRTDEWLIKMKNYINRKAA